ncbi:MAG TPA: PKD domain-containing protein [Bacteroidales bacterium]|mgnify:CR=1 FL=1|nr:PKD domain-containing protein [Bacteroidales bacterium]HPD24319.1 PKD domain-containing protein [Bacteroidales bacterium]HRS98428.1 PKD domain-containing protein [Bacteroidales bacterium]HRT80441.1 PKD domain-containing protein [Bacteroidales bacterium]
MLKLLFSFLLLGITSLCLSQSYYDVQLLSINCPNGTYFYWNNLQNPSITIKNSGTQTIQNVKVYYKIDENEEVERNLTGINLTPGHTRDVLFSSVSLPVGTHSVTARVELIDQTDIFPSNNISSAQFSVTGADIAIGKIIFPQQNNCTYQDFIPQVYIVNYSNTTINSFNIKYRLDFFPLISMDINQTIPPNDSILITFESSQINYGSHTIQFICSNPNSYPDSNPQNNSKSLSFDYNYGENIQVQIFTDNYGSETSWNIKNSNNEIIASGSGYLSNTLYTIDLCINPGCYTLNVFDSFGDGMCAGYGNGFYKIIRSTTNQVLVEGCSFTFSISHNFCIEAPPGLPFVNFTKSNFNNCTGEISFYDLSACNPPATEWLWDFGDGNTSTEQNPVHIYNQNGVYSVSLQVANSFGTSSLFIPNFVEVNRDLPPLVDDVHFCKNSDVNLIIPTEYPENIHWFQNINDNQSFMQGNELSLTSLQHDTVFYYQFVSYQVPQYVGLQNNNGPGGYFGWSIDRAIYLNAYTDLIIKSAQVYASGTANRTITLKNSQGQVIDTKSISIENGESIIDLDLFIPQGNNFAIHLNPGNNLSYTGDYGGPNIGYPFTIENLISITGNNYSNSFWYFFYNIEVIPANANCSSARVPINFIMSPQNVFLGNDTTICYGNSFIITPQDNFETYLWSNGQTSPTLTVSEPGLFSVTTTDNYGCSANGEVYVNFSDELIFDAVITNASDYQANDGSISIVILSGNEPYSIIWSNFASGFSINNLYPGDYAFTITDGYGCKYTGSYTVETSSIKNKNYFSKTEVYPNPTTDYFIINSDIENYNLEIISTDGTVIKLIKIKDFSSMIDIKTLNPGIYYLRVFNNQESIYKKLIIQ